MEGLTVTLIGSSFLPWLWALFTRRKWSKTVTGVFVLAMTVAVAAVKELLFGNLSLSVFDPESFLASLGVILVTSQAIYTLFKESVQRVEGAAEIVRGGGSEGSVSTKEQLLDGLGDMAKQLAAEQLAKQVNKVEKVLPHKTSRIDEAVDRNYDTLIKLQEEGKFDEMVDVLLNENIEIEELADMASLPEVFDDYESVPG